MKNILTIFEKLKLKFNNDEFPKIFKNITGEINQKYNISWPSISVTKDKRKIKMKKIKEMFTHMERLMNGKLNEIEEDTTKPKKKYVLLKRIISKNESLSENKSSEEHSESKSHHKNNCCKSQNNCCKRQKTVSSWKRIKSKNESLSKDKNT